MLMQFTSEHKMILLAARDKHTDRQNWQDHRLLNAEIDADDGDGAETRFPLGQKHIHQGHWAGQPYTPAVPKRQLAKA